MAVQLYITTQMLPGNLDETRENIIKEIIQDFIKELGSAADTQLEPRLRSLIPIRTGKLRDAFRITRQGRKINIGFNSRAFYWRFQRTMRENHLRTTSRWLEQVAPVILSRVARRVIAKHT